MTEHTTDDTAEWLQSKDTIEATLHVDDGDELPIEVEDIAKDELEALEEKSEGGAEAEDQAIRYAINEYLVEPDIDPTTIPMRKRSVLWFGIQQAWSGVEDIQAAMDEIEIPGNRTR